MPHPRLPRPPRRSQRSIRSPLRSPSSGPRHRSATRSARCCRRSVSWRCAAAQRTGRHPFPRARMLVCAGGAGGVEAGGRDSATDAGAGAGGPQSRHPDVAADGGAPAAAARRRHSESSRRVCERVRGALQNITKTTSAEDMKAMVRAEGDPTAPPDHACACTGHQDPDQVRRAVTRRRRGCHVAAGRAAADGSHCHRGPGCPGSLRAGRRAAHSAADRACADADEGALCLAAASGAPIQRHGLGLCASSTLFVSPARPSSPAAALVASVVSERARPLQTRLRLRASWDRFRRCQAALSRKVCAFALRIVWHRVTFPVVAAGSSSLFALAVSPSDGVSQRRTVQTAAR